jgi:hypothetical protein
LLQHHGNRVTGEQKCGTDVGIHHVVVLLGARVDQVLIDFVVMRPILPFHP